MATANYEQFKKVWSGLNDQQKQKYANQYKNNATFQKFSKQLSGEANTKSTPVKTNNKTYYNDVTGDRTTKNVANTGEWDTSYVQDAGYWRDWTNWDYNADVSKDPNRASQMMANIKKDATANSKLFNNRADYEKYYNYDKRSNSQKQVLDEAWDNYSKYWLNSAENSMADDASKAADDKNKLKMNRAAKTYADTLPYVMEIRNKLNDRLGPVFDDLKNYQTKYLNDMSELRKLQNDYYAGRKRELDALAAWQSASVGTTLSGQGLSQSAIASTIDWVDKNWMAAYNKLMKEHIDTLRWLQDSEQNFMNWYWTLMWNLSSAEQWALNDWLNSFKDLRKNLDDTYYKAIDERYNPYEVLTQAKVTGAAEWAQSTGKTSNKQATYQWADNTMKKSIIYNQFYGLLANDPESFKKIEPLIESAVAENPNDWQSAVTAVITKAGGNAKTVQKVVDYFKKQDDKEVDKNPDWKNEDTELANYTNENWEIDFTSFIKDKQKKSNNNIDILNSSLTWDYLSQ